MIWTMLEQMTLYFEYKQFQRDMCKYGDTCVCMDATHGTNMYDFNLITVLVIDEFGDCWCGLS